MSSSFFGFLKKRHITTMPGTEEAQKLIKEFSDKNIDDCCRSSTFTVEVEEARYHHTSGSREMSNCFDIVSPRTHTPGTSLLAPLSEVGGRLLPCKHRVTRIRTVGSVIPFSRNYANKCSLFEKSAIECLADACWLERYLIQRGGRCKPTSLEVPACEFPDNPVEPIKPLSKAVETERKILDDLERLMHLADKAGCYSLCTALDKRFLGKQTHHVKDMADLLQQTVRVSKNAGQGIFHLDRELRRTKGNLPWGKVNDPDSVALAIENICSQLSNVEV